MKTDAQLRDDIQAELAWDPSFKASDVGVIVKDGVVTLTGHLASFAEKYAVERAVQRVHGVKAVAVEITVKLPFDHERTDADVAQAAERALEWNVLVPDGKIHPMVEKGWLTLNGEVEWDYQRRAAESAVRTLMGVRGVSNLVTVTPKASPADVEKKIHDALARQAEREARHLAITVTGSQVSAARQGPFLGRAQCGAGCGMGGAGRFGGRERSRGGQLTRVALVTGGTSGIGAATAEALQSAGYRVAANYGSRSQVAEAFTARTSIAAFAWDVADAQACAAGVARVEAELGPVEVLVNNAGITRDAMLHKMSFEQWKEVLDVNLGGCFNMCRAVIGGMRERRFGRIVNIGSVNGLSGQLGQTNYAATKAGLIGFTKSLALEGASRNITANVVAPGYTDTAMVEAVDAGVMAHILASIPAGRLATPAEIARGVVFLASDDAGFITGTTLSIDGGKYMA